MGRETGTVNVLNKMSQQPESTTTSPAKNSAPRVGYLPGMVPVPDLVPECAERCAQLSSGDPQSEPPRIPCWLERLELLLRVLLRIYVGLAICYLPWSGELPFFSPWSRYFWDQNPLFLHFPTLALCATNGAVRGMISGLGLLNLWIALQDAIRHWNR
jgi:hypothetical protein